MPNYMLYFKNYANPKYYQILYSYFDFVNFVEFVNYLYFVLFVEYHDLICLIL